MVFGDCGSELNETFNLLFCIVYEQIDVRPVLSFFAVPNPLKSQVVEPVPAPRAEQSMELGIGRNGLRFVVLQCLSPKRCGSDDVDAVECDSNCCFHLGPSRRLTSKYRPNSVRIQNSVREWHMASGPEPKRDTPSRRQRQRSQLLDDITSEARRLLEAGGPGNVGWRKIASSVGLSPASLYTYFDSLDDLFTAMIVGSYRDLASSIESTLAALPQEPAGDRALAGPLTYRLWALANRGQFNIVFTDQIPGYTAPPGGVTVDAQRAVFRPMAIALARARGDRDVARRNESEFEDFFGLWGLFHGLTSLEVNHHLDWIDAERIYEQRIRWHLEKLDVSSTPNLHRKVKRLRHLNTQRA